MNIKKSKELLKKLCLEADSNRLKEDLTKSVIGQIANLIGDNYELEVDNFTNLTEYKKAFDKKVEEFLHHKSIFDSVIDKPLENWIDALSLEQLKYIAEWSLDGIYEDSSDEDWVIYDDFCKIINVDI